MTAAEAIADLDAALARTGESVVVRRYTAPTGTPRPKTDTATLQASVRPLKPEELVGGIDQSWSRVIMSPTGLAALLPIVKGDKVVIQGRERNVQFPGPIYVAGTLVRVELMVSG